MLHPSCLALSDGDSEGFVVSPDASELQGSRKRARPTQIHFFQCELSSLDKSVDLSQTKMLRHASYVQHRFERV